MDWTIQNAREKYSTAHWGGGYVDINDQGHLLVRPDRGQVHPGVDLHELARELTGAGYSLPVLARFSGILHDRVDSLCRAFGRAMEDNQYRGRYTAVYPIKVNQQRSVVEQIMGHGGDRVGLEAGSKPELLAVLAMMNVRNGVIICNGYKDREYIRFALIGRQLGHRVYLVVEKPSELELILDEAKALGVEPLLGIRVRLASIGSGKWQNTGGEKSKFGLSADQVLSMVERLKETGAVQYLQLLHFHLGSQIANIRDIQRGMREAARYYTELHRLQVPITCVDVGGGLGVDYEGTRSRSFCSINYSVQEYANNIVRTLWELCEDQGLPHPDIITESGRAMTAHHAVLITNVIDIERIPTSHVSGPPAEDDPTIVHDLWRGLNSLSERSALEAYHDAVHWLAEAQAMYTLGVITLEQRARAEGLYFDTCERIQPALQGGARNYREVVDELAEKLADKYFCNFSVFQSLPDVWAIEQIFPIVPLARLNERPTRRAVIQDLTCDSDGRIDYYVDGGGVDTTLPLHEVRPGESYLLGIFMVGAY
ncbi:MAG TPA: biosynthetic arginine decarboxylase, partial [Gammaproteobacteria bacterium]|nr:biosynthetic arginine decarboxylase [Gammaproteobacteria bacterium]